MMKTSGFSQKLSGIWSAAPTPFTKNLEIDAASVERMIEHHVSLGVKGIFLCGSCGEGPWMTDAMRSEVVSLASRFSGDRLVIAMQVTDNSAARVLDNISRAVDAGAQIAVMAAPYFHMNPTTENLEKLYLEIAEKSRLPLGLYDRGKFSSVKVPAAILAKIALHENVIMVKDSSGDPENAKQYLKARDKCGNLSLFNGDEFRLPEYCQHGYDGAMLGGAVFNGYMAQLILSATARGDYAEGERLQEKMTKVMLRVFGGEAITCWLTGQKELLVEMGIFSTNASFLNYPLTDSCIEEIKAVLKEEHDLLFPTAKEMQK